MLTSLAPPVLEYIQGKWPKFCTSPTTVSLPSISFAMIFFGTRIQTTRNYPIWCSRWSGMEIWWSKSSVHAAAN
eukprot:1137245-Pelagomonas_calceolata.AAC.3